MTTPHHIFLIPGFFGFVNMGELLYFAHVQQVIEEQCEHFGMDVRVHALDTHPTASIRTRTTLLAEAVSKHAPGDGPIHLVGHSTGGLDARLLCAPGVSLDTTVDVEALASRVHSVVMISTPHHGTPLASLFLTVFGRQLLSLTSVVTALVLRYGSLPVGALLKMAALVTRLDDAFGLTHTVADQLFDQLLKDMSRDRREQLRRFLKNLTIDQALLTQLTEEGADIIDASTSDRPTARYGAVTTRATPPSLGSALQVGIDPYAHATHAAFSAFYRITRRNRRGFPPVSPAQAKILKKAYGSVPDKHANDGVVPTRSQVRGTIIHATKGDHLDTIGHFPDKKRIPPHYDWMTSGSGFNRSRFETLWHDVVRFMAVE